MNHTTVLSLPYFLLFTQYVCSLPVALWTGWERKKGFLWAIGVWSAGACLHTVCGIVTEAQGRGLHQCCPNLPEPPGDVVVTIATVSMYCFLAALVYLLLEKPVLPRRY